MPDPLTNNDKAAAYVYYYASPHMVEATVNRLYHGGMRHQHLARTRAEHEMYPPVRPARRTPAQIESYLQQRVHGELLRRQQHRAVLRRELYPTSDECGARNVRRLSKAELQKHLQQVYEKPKTLNEWRRMCWQGLTSSEPERHTKRVTGSDKLAVVGKGSSYPNNNVNKAVAQREKTGQTSSRSDPTELCWGQNKHEKLSKERMQRAETIWRVPSASVRHKADAEARLFSQRYYEVCAAQVHAEEERLRRRLARRAKRNQQAKEKSDSNMNAQHDQQAVHDGYEYVNEDGEERSSCSGTESESEGELTARLRKSVESVTRRSVSTTRKTRIWSQQARTRRLSDLAKPLHVTPRFKPSYEDPHSPPSFRVVKKIDYAATP